MNEAKNPDKRLDTESEVEFTASYLLGYMRALDRICSPPLAIQTFLRELERIVENDKAYHAVKGGGK